MINMPTLNLNNLQFKNITTTQIEILKEGDNVKTGYGFTEFESIAEFKLG